MYNNQNGMATGAKWFFWLAIVILIGSFALGVNIKDAKWLNGKIASATAEQMNVATDVERQKAELDLQVLRAQTETQIAQQKQQAVYAAAKQQQELDALNVANTQKANFQESLYNTFNFGLKSVMIAICVVLTIIGINAGIGLYKFMNAKAQAIQPSQPSTVFVQENRRHPSPAAQKARQREREERERQFIDNRLNKIFHNTEQICTADDGKSGEFEPGNYPWAN